MSFDVLKHLTFLSTIMSTSVYFEARRTGFFDLETATRVETGEKKPETEPEAKRVPGRNSPSQTITGRHYGA